MARGGTNLSAYIAKAQRQGISQAETMRTLRRQGFSFSDSTFRSVWGELGAARALRGVVADANVRRRPVAGEISQISGGRQGTYLYRFDTFVRQRGEAEVLASHIGIKSTRLISYAAAMDLLMDTYAANEDEYDSELVALLPAAVNEFTG